MAINIHKLITKVRISSEKDFNITRDNFGDFLLSYGTRHCHYATTLTNLKIYLAKLTKDQRQTKGLVENEMLESRGPRTKASKDMVKQQVDLDDRVVDIYDQIAITKIAIQYVAEILEVFKSYRSVASAIKEQIKIEHM